MLSISLFILLSGGASWGVCREEHGYAGLNVGWQSQQSDHICLDGWGHSVFETVAIPDAEFVNAADREDQSCNFIWKFKLLADESHDQILPDLVGISFRELEPKRCALLMLFIFPLRLDASLKQVNRGALRHVTWSLQMLVDAPKLVNSVKSCKSLDVFGIPTVRLVLGIERIEVIQSPKGKELKLVLVSYMVVILTRRESLRAQLRPLDQATTQL